MAFSSKRCSYRKSYWQPHFQITLNNFLKKRKGINSWGQYLTSTTYNGQFLAKMFMFLLAWISAETEKNVNWTFNNALLQNFLVIFQMFLLLSWKLLKVFLCYQNPKTLMISYMDNRSENCLSSPTELFRRFSFKLTYKK